MAAAATAAAEDSYCPEHEHDVTFGILFSITQHEQRISETREQLEAWKETTAIGAPSYKHRIHPVRMYPSIEREAADERLTDSGILLS